MIFSLSCVGVIPTGVFPHFQRGVTGDLPLLFLNFL